MRRNFTLTTIITIITFVTKGVSPAIGKLPESSQLVVTMVVGDTVSEVTGASLQTGRLLLGCSMCLIGCRVVEVNLNSLSSKTKSGLSLAM
ncbi:hypothetical protein [Microbulbifer yueqingensis]|uniref:hypothetical protein n=1 Tax=Microbulbifer yueqingensis TaxID=658219 RepID=UPI00111365D7|nr:hypothetical protein [Microbulbifer yueqingensis]